MQRAVLFSPSTSWRQSGYKPWWCSRTKSICRQQEAITFQVSSLLVRLRCERYDIFKAKWTRKSFRPPSSGSSELPRDHYRSRTGRRPEWRQLKWHLLAQSNKDAILQNVFSMRAWGELCCCLSRRWNASYYNIKPAHIQTSSLSLIFMHIAGQLIGFAFRC